MGIFNFIKKEETVIRDYKAETVEGAEVWLVSWDARFGKWDTDKKRVAKAFFNENDARDFKESLEMAQNLIQYTENINIKIEKQS